VGWESNTLAQLSPPDDAAGALVSEPNAAQLAAVSAAGFGAAGALALLLSSLTNQELTIIHVSQALLLR